MAEVTRNGQDVIITTSVQEAKVLLALFDNSSVPPIGLSEAVFYGLVAFRDQLLWDVGSSINVDTNDTKQMGTLYQQVNTLLGPKPVEVTA